MTSSSSSSYSRKSLGISNGKYLMNSVMFCELVGKPLTSLTRAYFFILLHNKNEVCQIVQTYICAIDTPLYCGYWKAFSLTSQDLVHVSIITTLEKFLDHWRTCKNSHVKNGHPKKHFYDLQWLQRIWNVVNS